MSHVLLVELTKRFGSVTAVADLTLSVGDGEFFALLGPSGCGKTTIMRLVAGLESPTHGRVIIGEKDVTSLPPRGRDVAMVFQDYALYPHMTIAENVGYPLKVRGFPKHKLRQQVQEVAESLQIAHLLDRRPAQLSGGQQQRAALARALVYRARAYLFDEPLSNLDAKLRLDARGFLKHLQKTLAITTIYVTHDQAEAMALADRVGVMRDGQVLQVGTPLEVYRRPRSMFVATFLGSPPMNLVRCHFAAQSTCLVGPSFCLDASARSQSLRGALRDGEAIWLGIRPEHLSLAGGPGPSHFPGEVYAVQSLGAESLVTVELEQDATSRPQPTLVTVRLFEDELPTLKEQVWLSVNMDRVLIYHESGELAA
jgi:ABC-type sugar transport system ATPase subunit